MKLSPEKIFIAIISSAILMLPLNAYMMSSASYQITADSINIGGGGGDSTLYHKEDTVGEVATDVLSGTNYGASAGYQAMTDSFSEPSSEGESAVVASQSYGFSGQYMPVKFGKMPILINGGAKKTGSRQVTVIFEVENANEMQISDNRNFYGSFWQKYAAAVKLNLPSGDGQKTVYARFRPVSGLLSKAVSASIFIDASPPPNISELAVAAGDQKIFLSWKNPPDGDFSKVIVVRRQNYYPADARDGKIIYEGREEATIDFGLANGASYYYSVFAYDELGNYSSGAIADIVCGVPETFSKTPANIAETTDLEKINEASEFVAGRKNKIVNLSQVEFIQPGKNINKSGNLITAYNLNPLLISIPYGYLPEIFGNIIVSIARGNKNFSFLFKKNSENTAYQANVVLPETGDYNFDIIINSRENRPEQKISGILRLLDAKAVEKPLNEKTADRADIKKFPLILGAIFILFPFCIFLIYLAARKIADANKIA